MRILAFLMLALLLGAPAAAAAAPPGVATASAMSPVSAEAGTTAATTPGRRSTVGAGPDLRLPKDPAKTSDAVRTALILTFLALLPALAVCMTPFIRFVVVLSMIRHAFGMPETPPSQVLVSLAFFLTIFTMGPTLTLVNSQALQPFIAGDLSVQQAVSEGAGPMKAFMLRQVQDQDLKAVYDISRQPLPDQAADVDLAHLTTAFMLNELRVAFKIGFVVLLPFLLIDLVVSGILLALGMMMVPPTTISLPIKVLMFVLIDGWSLVLHGVVGSFR